MNCEKIVITKDWIKVAAALGACPEVLDWLREEPRTFGEMLRYHHSWFGWANSHHLVPLNFQKINLSEARLSEAKLQGLFLQEANLEEADLSEAKLTCACLQGANLRNADLTGADLRYANLSRADLRGANLSDADLYRADLREADVTRAIFYDARNAEEVLQQFNVKGGKEALDKIREQEYGRYRRCW